MACPNSGVVTIKVPFDVRRRGDRKLVLAPDGAPLPTVAPHIDTPLVRPSTAPSGGRSCWRPADPPRGAGAGGTPAHRAGGDGRGRLHGRRGLSGPPLTESIGAVGLFAIHLERPRCIEAWGFNYRCVGVSKPVVASDAERSS